MHRDVTAVASPSNKRMFSSQALRGMPRVLTAPAQILLRQEPHDVDRMELPISRTISSATGAIRSRSAISSLAFQLVAGALHLVQHHIHER